jgi:hypothetical protein
MITLNAQQLADAIQKDWFINGVIPSDAVKVTSREIQTKLVNFRQVTRALGMPQLFDMDTAEDAAEIIESNINKLIDYERNVAQADRG